MADRYWRGGTGTWNTSSTTNWSATSGGAGGASVPTASDNVIFDQAGTYNVTMTGALTCLSITVSAGTVSFLTGTAPTLAVSGSMSLIAGTVWTSTGAITFNATTTGQTITTGGTTINGAITFNGTGGAWTLGDALTTGVTLTTTLTAGTLNLNNFNLTTGIFSSSNTNTRSINFGSGNIILSHTTAAQTVLSMATATGFTYTSSGTFTSGTGCFQATMSTTRTFTFGTTGGTATNAPNLYLTSGASIATITTASWFNELNFGTTAFTIAATSLNLNNLSTSSSSGVLTALTATMRDTGAVSTTNRIGPLIINHSGTTTMQNLATNLCTTLTVTSGNLVLESNCVLNCTTTATLSGGTLLNYEGLIQCTTFTIAGSTFVLSAGAVAPSVSFVITSGSFTLNFSPAGGLGAVPTFTHTAGTVQFNSSYSLTATGTYTLTAGTLTINDNITLTTGIFSSSNTNTRTINFGLTSPGWITLSHTTAATVVLSMAIVTGLTVTEVTSSVPAGGFISDASISRTFTCGTTGGNAANSPCLYFTSGTALPTFTTGSWFNILYLYNLGNIGTLAATTLNLNGLVSSPGGGVYTSMSVNFVGTGTAQCSGIASGPVNINNGSGLLTLFGALVSTTCTFTSGSVDHNGYYITPTTTFTYVGGTFVNGPYITCTTFTVSGGTLTLTSPYEISPTTSFVITAGTFIYNGGTLPALPTFTHTAGNVTFNYNYSLTATGTYTLTAGSLVLTRGVTLNTGIFSSTGAGTRSIGFGSTISSSTTGSIYFDGSTSYLTVADNDALALGTGDFTIEAWINPNDVSAGANQFNIITLSNTQLQFFVSGGSLYFYDTTQNISGGTVVVNQWQHVALTRIGTLVTCYINGVPCISTTSSVNFVSSVGLIGTNSDPGGTRANGYISNLRVVKGLSVYTLAAFTPPTTPLTAVTNTQLLVDAASSGAYLTDGSTNNFTLTPTGSVTYNASTPISSGGSLYFNQSTISYLTLPSSTAFNLTGDFTIEAWINPTTILAGENGILDARVAGGTAAPWAFYVGGDGKLQFFTGSYYAGTSVIETNVWTFVAVVRSGSTLTFYINGVQDGSTTIGTAAISPGATEAMIGTKDFGINDQFRTINYITNLRFVNGTALYTPNSGSFTPPTSTLAITQTANTNGNPSAAISALQTSLLLNAAYGSNFLTDSSLYSLALTNNTATSAKISPYLANINLTHTTAATVVLNMVALGGFSWTGTGGFTVADMSNTRTFSVGSTSGGSQTTAPNLTFTTGASVATLTTNSWFNNLDYGSTTFVHAASTLNIDGNVTLGGGTYPLTLNMIGTGTINSNAKSITALTIGSATYAGTTTLGAALTITGALTLTQGTLLCPYNITSASFASAGALAKTMTGTNVTYVVNGAGATAFSNTGTNLTMVGLIISMTNAAAKTFAGGGGTYPVLNNGGAGALTISGSNTFDTISNSVQPTTFTFTIATTQTVNNFNVAGIAGSLVTINSSTAASVATLSKASGTVYGAYLSIRDSTATGGATWYAGPTSTNTSNNTGWIFTRLPIVTMGNLVIDGGISISSAAV